MQNIPRIGVGVAVLTADGYVLLKRKGSHGEGEWAFPGGHLEFGESVDDCSRREILEEIGVPLEAVTTLPIYTEDFFPGKHYITLYTYGYTRGRPKIMEPNKATELLFVKHLDNLPTPLFSGVVKAWEYIKKLNNSNY
jgi:8-oxo-dGTP diphosphatase